MPTATKTKRPRKASAPKDKHLTEDHARLACEVNGAVMPSAAGPHRSDLPHSGVEAVGTPGLQAGEDVKEDQRELQRTAALQTMREEFATLKPAQFDLTRPGTDIYAWERHQRIVAKYRAAMKAIG